jgi:hypothetical protein
MSYKKNVYKVWENLIYFLSEEPSEIRNNQAIALINKILIFNS